MRPTPPNSDRDAWIARMRDTMHEQRDELLTAPLFPAYGLSSPSLAPFALAGSVPDDPRYWRSVTLWYGDRRAVAGPFVSVTTDAGGRVRRRDTDRVLRATLDAERALLPVFGGGPAFRDCHVRVDGRQVRGRVCDHADVWVARLTLPSRLPVTVCGRGVRSADVRLVEVDSLAPYWHGREEMFGLPWGT